MRNALALSLWEGGFATLMLGATETFGIPAAVALGAPALSIAMLGSLPLFLGSLGQLAICWYTSPDLARRRPVLCGVLAQCLFLLGCAMAGLLDKPWSGWGFVVAFILFGVSGNLTGTFWISWMRDLTPAAVRGRLFAARNRTFVLVQLASSLSLGLVARHYRSSTAPWSFFFAIFVLAALCRALSATMLALQYEPVRTGPAVSLRTLRPSRNFVHFCLASALLQGATALSGPFFNVWFLTELHFDYLTFALGSASSLVGSFVFLPIWGRVADRIGSFRLMLGAAALVSIVPLPYLWFDSPAMIWAFNAYSGVAWSAYNLGNFNVLLESVGTKHAEREIAVAVAITGVAVFAFGFAGGVLATQLPKLEGSRLRTLFLLSGLTRMLVVLLVFRVLKPAAPLPNTSPLDGFNEFPGYRFGMGILRTAFRAFRRQ